MTESLMNVKHNVLWNTCTHTHMEAVIAPLMRRLSPHCSVTGCVFWDGGGWQRRGEGGKTNGRLFTCLASSKDVCSLLISFSYCSFILSTSWSWAATSSLRAPFRAVSSLSRLLSVSSCSSLARRISCISTLSCIMSCEKWGQVG